MLGEKYIVNGEQVEDLEIIPTENGGYVVNFKKIFNIIDAKTIEIIGRLKKDDIKCYVIKYNKKKIIILYNFNIDDLYKIIDTLRLYQNNYEVDYNQKQIIIDIP